MSEEQFSSPKSLYMQINNLIKEKIRSGEYKPGGRIPSEKELCEEFSVSRITIRNALSEATKDGLLFTVQGKGTFVSENNNSKVSQTLLHIDFFEDTIKNTGMTAGTILLGSELQSSSSELQKILMLEPHEKVLQLDILGTANMEPFVLYQSFFQEDIGRLMYDRASEKQEHGEAFSTLNLYKNLRFLNASHIDQTFEAIPADSNAASILKIKKNYPLFLVSSIIYSTTDIPLEYKKAFYRSDRYKFHMNRRIE